MTITHTNVRKSIAASFVGVALLFSAFAPSAHAQSVSDLQAQITALLAQITALQAQLGGGSGNAAACTFTRALTIGASGADVTCLQNYLIGAGHTIPAGATGYFGTQTQAAVASWQAANGVAPAAGYFGPISQAKYSMLIASTPTPNPSDDDDDDDDGRVTLRGEASLEDVDLKDGDDTSLEEGQNDAPVAEFEVEFRDGDARITRMDVSFVASGDEEDPWDTFDQVSLWVDGDMVAEQAVDDEDDWLSDERTIRFAGLDIVAEEDEQLTIVIAVSVQGSVDDVPATWNVDVTSLRFVDGDNVSSTETINVGTVNFDIDEEGTDDELTVRTSSDDPDATTLQVERNEKSDWLTVFAFDLDTDDSVNDIEINNIPVRVTFSSSTYNALVSDAMLVIDGEEFDDVTVTGGGNATATLNFDIDGDLVIDAGDRVTAELMLEFRPLSAEHEGVTVQASVNADDIDAEGADDLVGGQLSGSATGDVHTLRTEGVILDLVSTTESIRTNAADDVSDDEGNFVIRFDVTAFESDIWVNKTAASGTALGTAGVNFLVEDAEGNQVTLGTSSASLGSNARTDGTRFKVNEGETKTFTLTVNYDPAERGFYQVQLYSFNFRDSNNNPNTQQIALPQSAYETDQISI